MTAPLELSRAQVLAHRRRVGALEGRLPHGADSLRRAAWAGLQDSMPRAALLSIHARVEGTQPTTWEDPSLVQVWGPRFSAFVVAAADAAVFTLGRLPDDPAGLKRAESTADRLEAFLGGRTMSYADAGHGIGIDPNSLRHGAPTGRIRIRWEGARRPTIWTVPRPDVEPPEARRELARRYLTVLGPGTADTFAEWAGIRAPRARRIFDDLAPELTAVRTPIGDGWILAADEPSFGQAAAEPDPSVVRLLPSGDAWFLLWGADRDAARAGRGPPRRAVDVARLAWGDPRRRRDRRRLAASLGGRLAVDVANALARRARRRRRRGGVVAATRRPRTDPGQLGWRRRLMWRLGPATPPG